MKLTKTDREAFVRAVMDDVPQVDYDEQAKKLATSLALASIPKRIQDVYNDKEQRSYLSRPYIGLPHPLQAFYGPPHEGVEFYKNDELKALAAKLADQNAAREALRLDITSMIAACSTLKQAEERLPEFAKYLPAERGSSGLANLPVANVVASLTKAGWPKGQERAAA